VARRRLGQHFLIRGAVLERIARLACPARESLVLEIGPGKGFLTERLLGRADRVVALEIDPGMIGILERRLQGKAGLELVAADALDVDFTRWSPSVVAGNLPYYAATPIIERTLEMCPAPARAVFLVQKEVAERLAARTGTRDYGFLTVRRWLWADAKLAFTVPPAAFDPPPAVDSAVVVLTPRDRAGELGLDPGRFLEFAGLCFRQKRKTLRNNLAGRYGAAAGELPEAGLRAEQIEPEALADIFRRLERGLSPTMSLPPSGA
jgi:16S rRNA (adenine1518-N6/adenine1519-N6)-dimethyltransferase